MIEIAYWVNGSVREGRKLFCFEFYLKHGIIKKIYLEVRDEKEKTY